MTDNLLVLGRAADPPARVLRRIGAPGDWHWAYFGSDFPQALRVAQAVGSRAHRLDVGEELRRAAHTAARDLVEGLAYLREEDEPLDWWTDSLSERSPYMSPLIRECTLLRVVEKWLEGPGPLLLVTEGEALRTVIARVARARGWRVVDAAGWLRRARMTLQCRLRRIGAPLLFLVAGLTRLFQRRLTGSSWTEDSLPTSPDILCFTFVSRETLSRPHAGSDPYWGPLLSWLRGRGHQVALVPVTVGRPLPPAEVVRLLARGGTAVIVPEDHLRVRDYLWAVWRGVRAARRPLPAVSFGGIDIRPLCAEERDRHGGSLRLPLTLLQYRLGLRLSQDLPVLRACLYPFENQVWERALLLGLRRARPDLETVGFQHSTIAPLEMNYFPAVDDWEGLPLPDRVVCQGERFRELLQAAGYPSSRLAVGGSLRYRHLLEASDSRGRRMSGPGRTVVILLPIALPAAAEVLWKAMKGLVGMPRVRLIVRAHPFTPLGIVRAALGEPELPAGVEEGTGPLEGLLEGADCIVYRDTSAALEAVMRGIPGVYVASEVTVDNDPLDLLGPLDGLKRVARSAAQIQAAVKELLTAGPEVRVGWLRTGEALRDRTLHPVHESGLRAFLMQAEASVMVAAGGLKGDHRS